MPRATLKNLPPSVRTKLQNWRKGADDAVVFSSPAGLAVFAAAAISSVWLIVLSLMSFGFRWRLPMIIVCGVATFVACYFIVKGLVEILLKLRQETEDSLVVTPSHIFEFSGDELEYRSLESLVTVQERHRYEHGQYRESDITLAFDGGVSRTVQVKGLDIAEDAVEKIGLYKKRFLESASRGQQPNLNFDREISGSGDQSSRHFTDWLTGPLVTVAGGLFLAALSMGIAVYANEYFDDVRNWDLARNSDRASGYRQYLRIFPNGRWKEEAGTRLQVLYDAAESKYRASLNDGYDKGAVDAISSILRYARDTGNYQVQVVFDRRAEISENMIEEIKEDFGVKKVLPLGDSFSNEKMIARESELVGVFSHAFRDVFPEDILEITQGCSAGCAEALVIYDTSFRDSIYFPTAEKNLPEEDRTYEPGILINWTFRITIPLQSKMYEFALESVPAKTIYYDSPTLADGMPSSDVARSEKNSFYDAMVASAFDDFRRNLVFKLGIGPEPSPQADPEAEQTPQLEDPATRHS